MADWEALNDAEYGYLLMADTDTDDTPNSRAAVAKLQAAIKAVRAACGDDPECKVLLSALDTAEAAASDYASDDEDDDQPKDLKTAAERTRQEFSRRKSAR